MRIRPQKITLPPTPQTILVDFSSLEKEKLLVNHIVAISEGNSIRCQRCRVVKEIHLSPFHYNAFASNLTFPHDWLANSGGWGSDTDPRDSNPRPNRWQELSQSEKAVYLSGQYYKVAAVMAEGKTTLYVSVSPQNRIQHLGIISTFL